MNTLLITQLQQLQEELQHADLWESTAPSTEALMSTEPFCVDTLSCEQWLQWIFIPKLTTLAQSPEFAGLPHTSDIHSMAEHAFKEYTTDTAGVCAAIQRIDTTLNTFA